jgi:NADPH-dependent 2,4-dienoyl-CoA reductase/sulfur reductase-like enzyme
VSEASDLAVIGAGPAGLAAAVRARRLGLSVTLLDEQPAPGGQIWRAIEARAAGDARLHHEGDAAGLALVEAFRASGATYLPGRQVWQVEPGFAVYASLGGSSERLAASTVLLATGAQERPVPFPGWTLPGVMPVGAAQILLKTSGQIPDKPVVIAGSGPLILLYACQLLAAGGRIAAILDTAPRGNRAAALRHVPRALAGYRDLLRGLGWLRRLRAAGIEIMRHVRLLEAQGGDALQAVRYATVSGEERTMPAALLLVHEGVIPSLHMPLALGCSYRWREEQRCFAPIVDPWGETSVAGLYVAGDGAGIAGAAAAVPAGEITAIGAAVRLGRIDRKAADSMAAALRVQLQRASATRPMLDALYRPRDAVLVPDDATILCRCEEVTAGQVRTAARIGIAGPNQVKAFTRAGMGPCQGRQCGHAVSAILADVSGSGMDEIGFYRLRAPLKPVTLGELAALETPEISILA